MEEKKKLEGLQDYEIEWMLKKRPLVLNDEQLKRDLGKDVASEILEILEKKNMSHLRGCLAHHGVSTRWKEFICFVDKLEKIPDECRDAFVQFGNHLGRVISYRALSLTDSQYESIISEGEILPSGRLKTTEEELDKIVEENGINKICYGRLYISLHLYKHDPSLSLHDDAETAVIIASGYSEYPNKKVHLFEVNVPKVEVVGYSVYDLQDKKHSHEWFEFGGCMFCATWERTERYCLYSIPFLKQRMTSTRTFHSEQEITEFVSPFKEKQLKKFLEWKKASYK